jgi:hypothetical protein
MLSEKDFKNPDLKREVDTTSELKEFVVGYVGNKIANDEYVTVEMIVEIFAAEFPEFLMAVAEENFMRGYEQALVDLQETESGEEADVT